MTALRMQQPHFMQQSEEIMHDARQVFSLGERGNILLHLEGAALIPHIVQAEGKKFPGEVCRTEL